MKQKQKCEVYSRVVGYLRPVDQWNNGKQSEYEDRTNFDITKGGKSGKENNPDKI